MTTDRIPSVADALTGEFPETRPAVAPLEIGDDVGEIHPAGSAFLRTEVGTAEVDENSYELSLAGGIIPHVLSLTTGKQYVLDWKHIIDLARHMGIDQ
jgi:hypothetical protein